MSVQALVVDDDITIRTLLVLQLDKIDVKADSACNGIEALRRFHDWNYSLILMDINMPEMDGLEATSAIRLFERQNKCEPVPIIGISALCADHKDAALTAGMNACYQKPVLMDKLAEIVHDWMKPFVGDRKRKPCVLCKHGHGRVLLLCDHPEHVAAVRDASAKAGLDTVVVGSVQEGIEYIEATGSVDVVVCHAYLERGNVFELLKAAKHNGGPNRTRFILVSCQAAELTDFFDPTLKDTSEFLGADKYVIMPEFDVRHLLKEILAALPDEDAR